MRTSRFILHNVDVLSTIDLDRMVQFHRQSQALATLAVQERKTSRYLLFDAQDQLCGRCAGKEKEPELVRSSVRTGGQMRALAFSGVHVISPRLLTRMTEDAVFSIITSYLQLAGAGERIVAFRADEYYWRDLGRPENVKQAEGDVKQGILRLS